MNILFAHTTGPWWDHRYYFKQMPALHNKVGKVSYLITDDGTLADDIPYDLIPITKRKSKNARLTGGFNLLQSLTNKKVDAIQLCNIELLPVGIFLAIFTSKKIFYDCREDHYHAMLHSKVWFPKWYRWILAQGVKILEFLAAKTFTGFVDSDPAIYKFHTAVPKSRKMIFYNMALKQQFGTSMDMLKYKKNYDFVVLGSMSIRTGVLDVVKAIAILKDKGHNVKLKLIGAPYRDKVLWAQIEDVMKKYQLDDNIHITGRVQYFKIPIELQDCKIGIIPLLDIPKFRNNIATKQFEYMASGIPIIASNLQPQRYFIKNNYNGLHYEPGNVEELSEKMLELLLNDKLRETMSRNALNDVINNNINSESQQDKYVEFYSKRLAGKAYTEKQIPE